MKKGDVILIASVLFAAAVLFFVPKSAEGKTVTVKKNNSVVYKESIKADKTLNLKTNTVVIKDGTVFMKEATCKNQICVKTGKISKSGESIICLPNKISVTIE